MTSSHALRLLSWLIVCILFVAAEISLFSFSQQLGPKRATIRYYLRSEAPTHGQPWNPNDTGRMTKASCSEETERNCSSWVLFWFDDADPIENWSIREIHFHFYWKANNGSLMKIGYQCEGSFDAEVDKSWAVGIGDGAYHVYDSVKQVLIEPFEISNKWYFAVKGYLLNKPHDIHIGGESDDPAWIQFTYELSS